jgi:hypothetical protein
VDKNNVGIALEPEISSHKLRQKWHTYTSQCEPELLHQIFIGAPISPFFLMMALSNLGMGFI